MLNTNTSSSEEQVIPQDNDVLLGRGRGHERHPGNVRYTELLNRHYEAYNGATRRFSKSDVTETVVGLVQAEGRFLKHKNGRWILCGDEEAHAKVSQGLRYRGRKVQQEEAKKRVEPEVVPSTEPSRRTYEELQPAPEPSQRSPRAPSLFDAIAANAHHQARGLHSPSDGRASRDAGQNMPQQEQGAPVGQNVFASHVAVIHPHGLTLMPHFGVHHVAYPVYQVAPGGYPVGYPVGHHPGSHGSAFSHAAPASRGNESKEQGASEQHMSGDSDRQPRDRDPSPRFVSIGSLSGTDEPVDDAFLSYLGNDEGTLHAQGDAGMDPIPLHDEPEGACDLNNGTAWSVEPGQFSDLF